MQIKGRALTVGTTLFLAAATGHLMQSGDNVSARLRAVEMQGAHTLTAIEKTSGMIAAQPAISSKKPALSSAAVKSLPKLAEIEPEPASDGAVIASASETGEAPGPVPPHKIENDQPVGLYAE